MDRDSAVQAGAVAGGRTGVVADPAADRWQRIVGDELAPRLLVAACLRMSQPRLDVLPGRAASVARRQQVNIDRPTAADRPGQGPVVQQVNERRQVARSPSRLSRVHLKPLLSSIKAGPLSNLSCDYVRR